MPKFIEMKTILLKEDLRKKKSIRQVLDENTEGDETSYMWTFQERIRIHHTHIREDKKRECQQIKKVLKRHRNILIEDERRSEEEQLLYSNNGRNVKDN
jgi:hypothetical protein